jgi:hypothetical protein
MASWTAWTTLPASGGHRPPERPEQPGSPGAARIHWILPSRIPGPAAGNAGGGRRCVNEPRPGKAMLSFLPSPECLTPGVSAGCSWFPWFPWLLLISAGGRRPAADGHHSPRLAAMPGLRLAGSHIGHLPGRPAGVHARSWISSEARVARERRCPGLRQCWRLRPGPFRAVTSPAGRIHPARRDRPGGCPGCGERGAPGGGSGPQ